MGIAEQRGARRLERRFILRAALFNESVPRWSHLTIHNLSSGGVYFTLDREARVGMLLHFKIDFPDRTVECLGRVRRLGDMRHAIYQDVGASFEGLRAEDRSYIDDFVQKNSGF